MSRRWLFALVAVVPLVAMCALDSRSGRGGDLPVARIHPRGARLSIDASLLEESWRAYLARFVQDDGRVVDRKAGGASTSEGQAYALLRAVWMNDRATFDTVLQWSDNNLRANIRGDELFGWKWGHRDDGSWGIYDRNAASDADQLIALALLRAADRWREPAYRERARRLIADIWEKETVVIHRTRFVLPGDWHSPPGSAVQINPSYYFPFAYRVFAAVDPSRPWMELVDLSYRVFGQCRSRVGLPTDWCFVEPLSGELFVRSDLFDKSADFGYEAFRVFWTLAADYHWNREERALSLLEKMGWLSRYFAIRGVLPAVVTFDGIPREEHKYLGLYGAYLPALALVDPETAARLYREGIQSSFHAGLWGDPEDYYAQNWTWFGVKLTSELYP